MTAKSPYTIPVAPTATMAMELTRDELNEVHDALSHYVKQMISEGQTQQEIEYQSLASA